MSMQLRRKQNGKFFTVVNTKTRMIQNWLNGDHTRIITNPWGSYWVTKADFAKARNIQRVTLREYTGSRPRLAVFIQRIKEFFNRG